MAGEVRIKTVVQLIKFGGYRQFSVPKSPLLLAANRYKQGYEDHTNNGKQTAYKRQKPTQTSKGMFDIPLLTS